MFIMFDVYDSKEIPNIFFLLFIQTKWNYLLYLLNMNNSIKVAILNSLGKNRSFIFN